MIDRVHPELIWAYTLEEEKIGPIHLAFDIEVQRTLQGEERLVFSMLPNDPKLKWVGLDQFVVYGGEAWRILERNDSRTSNEQYVDFIALALWYDLGDEVHYGNFLIETETVRSGLEQILEGTNWTVGEATELGGNYSYEAKSVSKLQILRGWALITDHEIQFDTENRVVNFLPAVGQERGIGFRYGRNLDQVTRQYRAPQATRLYPIGASDMGIETVNGGIPYLENFDWYTDQGLTEEEARELFLKEAIWTDDRYLIALNLMDAATLRLADLSHPTISYECTVMDLSGLTGLAEDQFDIGDNVRVYDETFNIDIRTRIVRMTIRPYEPWNNKVELSYLKPGITNELLSAVSEGGGTGGSDWRLLVDENPPMNLFPTSVVVCSIELTSSDNAYGIIGGLFVGTGVGSGTVELTVFIDALQVGTTIEKDFSNDKVVEVGIPTWFANLIQGNHTVSLRARVIAGTGTINIEEFSCRLYVLMQGLVGGGLGGGSNSVVRISDVVPDMTSGEFSDSADAVLTVDNPDTEIIGVSDTIPDATEAPTESPIDIELS